MSDLLIKGMKMPKNCGCCPLAVGGRFTFTCMRLFGREYTYELAEQRQEDCPLKELPEHGRLIDADALGIDDSWNLTDTGRIWNAPTVLESTKEKRKEVNDQTKI